MPRMYSSSPPSISFASFAFLRASCIAVSFQSFSPNTTLGSLPSRAAATAALAAVGVFFVATNTSSPTFLAMSWRAVASSVRKSYQCFSSLAFSSGACGCLVATSCFLAASISACLNSSCSPCSFCCVYLAKGLASSCLGSVYLAKGFTSSCP